MQIRRGMFVGVVLTLAAAALTFIYLWLIVDAASLEALMFIPILGVLLAIAGIVGGRRGRSATWSVGLSLGMAATVGAAESIWWIWILTHWESRTTQGLDPGFPAPAEIFSITVLASISLIGSLTALALIASLLGWLVGSGARRLSLHRRPAPPLPAAQL